MPIQSIHNYCHSAANASCAGTSSCPPPLLPPLPCSSIASSSSASCTAHTLNNTNLNEDGTSISSYHRPFLRSALARSLYDRMMREEQLRKLDKSKWYKCNLDILPSHLKSLFVEMSGDEDTDRFIESCYQKSDWFLTHLYHSVARSFLNLFMTSTSINGLLGRGSMFVFSRNQFTTLYEEVDSRTSKENSCLLDLGAGDGRVTEVMAPFFKTTYVTEVSPVMRKILSKKGYKLLDVSSWDSDSFPSFDLISCLNLLDRCDRPLDILQSMTKKVKPDGRIIIALVFPLSQYVESTPDHRPVQVLNVSGETFEEQLISLENNVLIPAGIEIIKWTRLPYICEGDLDLSFYWLHDVVLVLKKKPSESSTN